MEADEKCGTLAIDTIVRGHVSFSVYECPVVFALQQLTKVHSNEEPHFIDEVHTVIVYMSLIVFILITYVLINSRPWL